MLHSQFPYILADRENYIYIIELGAILALLLFWAFKKRENFKLVLKNASIWLAIALVILIGYSYQYELKDFTNKIFGNLIPSMGLKNKDGSVTFYASQNGHFMIDTKINNYSVRFLLDTGASKVTLTQADAKRMGVDLSQLNYDIKISTANGVAFAAPFKIEEIKVGGSITVRNVDAYISQGNLDVSLLGMSFLNKLKKYEVTNNALTLWNEEIAG